MQASTVQLMRDQVHAIYRALTGTDLVEPDIAEEESKVDEEQVTRSFANLEALARHVPAVAQRVPPFHFAPPADMLDTGRELWIELAAPGVERADVSVERRDNVLHVQGVRRGELAADGNVYLLAEIPRGTFERSLMLPAGFESEPRVEVERGTITVRLTKTTRTQRDTSQAAGANASAE